MHGVDIHRHDIDINAPKIEDPKVSISLPKPAIDGNLASLSSMIIADIIVNGS